MSTWSFYLTFSSGQIEITIANNRINKRQSGYSLKWLPIQIHPDVALFTMVFCKSNSAFLVCTFVRPIISNLKDKNRQISIKLSRRVNNGVTQLLKRKRVNYMVMMWTHLLDWRVLHSLQTISFTANLSIGPQAEWLVISSWHTRHPNSTPQQGAMTLHLRT